MTGLFVPGEFTGHSGDRLHWKVECDALTPDDWRCLALMAASMLPPFHRVRGIPRGGLLFADALREHATPHAAAWLLVDDVWTTGGSFRTELDLIRERGGPDPDFPVCVAAFCRDPCPPPWLRWVLLVAPRVQP